MGDDRFGFVVDTRAATPPFEQLRALIAAGAADGTLVAGTRLPPVRRLAEDLGLAANTVARAYRELDAAGVVETRGRRGTFVAAGGNRSRARLQAAAHEYAALAPELGCSADQAIAFVRAAAASAQ